MYILTEIQYKIFLLRREGKSLADIASTLGYHYQTIGDYMSYIYDALYINVGRKKGATRLPLQQLKNINLSDIKIVRKGHVNNFRSL